MREMRYPCACCGYLTMGEETGSGSYNICPVCFWEDDGLQYDKPDFAGGANDLSLNESRENYKKFGATEKRFIKSVRKPRPIEIPNKK